VGAITCRSSWLCLEQRSHGSLQFYSFSDPHSSPDIVVIKILQTFFWLFRYYIKLDIGIRSVKRGRPICPIAALYQLRFTLVNNIGCVNGVDNLSTRFTQPMLDSNSNISLKISTFGSRDIVSQVAVRPTIYGDL